MTTTTRALHGMLLVVLLAGCAKRPAMLQASAPAPTGAAESRTTTGTSPAAPVAPPVAAPAAPTPPAQFSPVADLVDVHFDFDRYAIRPGDAKILDANAVWLKRNADDLVLIEGHCDERGTDEYNIALGERRAEATRAYLESRGIQANRITVISYGKERPLCTDHDEACWAKNRRAHFLVKPR